MTQAQRNTKKNGSKSNGVSKEVMRIVEKNLRKDRELLERLAKL